ncbi:hypothetical protein MML48_3g00009081 [Holotrichia oblita]|uniref:Uncharacterized protein n=1 Tax=Holotrichia oblita TaxID=644536 RepID=A0ACB9TGK7_HOLOL|nr:hypothetical protein MML48_3g00009081 [Holotrichia oblita]
MEIRDYHISPLGDGINGIFGEHWILNIKTKTDENVRFFVKSIPRMESMLFYIQYIDISSKEEGFYQKIIPAMKKLRLCMMSEVTPYCFMIKNGEFFIFEDLSVSGYKIYSWMESLPYEAVKIGLYTLAKLHAPSFIFEEMMSKQYGREYKIIEDFRTELKESFYCAELPSELLVESIIKGIETQIELFPDVYEDLDKDDFKKFVTDSWKNVKEFVKPSQVYRNVICHGDLWPGNIMFKDENLNPVKCILIDFQMYRYTPPALDVMLFLYLSTDREFRFKYREKCLDVYYENLCAILEENSIITSNILTKDDFLNSCNYYELFGITQCLSYNHMKVNSNIILKQFFDDTDVCKHFMYGDRSQSLIDFCKNDSNYRLKQKEPLLNFKDAFLKLQNKLHQ